MMCGRVVMMCYDVWDVVMMCGMGVMMCGMGVMMCGRGCYDVWEGML